jgi:hypothetical protein
MKKVKCIWWGTCGKTNGCVDVNNCTDDNCTIEKPDKFPLDFSSTVECKYPVSVK